jgi:DNA-binding transcriptional MerR regulator
MSRTLSLCPKGNDMTLGSRRLERSFSIRQLCVEFKVTPRTLRFYENKGLLSPSREGLNRVYHQRDHARLTLILRCKRMGLSLAEIREILDLYRAEDGGAAQIAHSLGAFRQRIVTLEAQRRDIDAAIDELHKSCARLETQLTAIRPGMLSGVDAHGHAMRTPLDGSREQAAE